MASESYQSATERIAYKPRIADLLKRIMEAHIVLLVRLPNDRGNYTSAILEVQPDKDVFVLDELNPTRGHERLLKVRTLDITARLAGVTIQFRTELKAVNTDEDVAKYVARIPNKLLYQQRRSAFRVRVGSNTSVPLTLSAEGGSSYHGYLADLSSTGLGAYMEHADELIDSGQKYFCKIQLPEGNFIATELDLRFSKLDDERQQLQIGGRFLNVNRPQQALLERYVMTLQRQAIKKSKNN